MNWRIQTSDRGIMDSPINHAKGSIGQIKKGNNVESEFSAVGVQNTLTQLSVVPIETVDQKDRINTSSLHDPSRSSELFVSRLRWRR